MAATDVKEIDMKTRNWVLATIAGLLCVTTAATAADLKKLGARPGSKMRIEGDSTVHKWQVESKIIGGSLEVGPNFPTEPGQKVEPGKVEASGLARIDVRSLQSVKADGSPYEDKMDAKMWSMMKQEEHPRIEYKLTELVLKEPAKSKDAPYVFDSKGDLKIAGVTKTISMPVNVTPLEDKDKKIKITGTIDLKMTDFNIQPATILFAKTEDEVKLIFTWIVAPPSTPAAAVAK